MAAEDHLPDFIPTELDDEQPVRCMYCGRDDLMWEEQPDGSWRLATPSGVLHTCMQYYEGLK